MKETKTPHVHFSKNKPEFVSEKTKIGKKISDHAQHENEGDADPVLVKKRKRNIVKNLLVVSFGFLLLFTAFQSLQNLQSSLNADEGLGTASLSVIYGGLIISCLFIPAPMIEFFGCKWTICISMCMYSVYMIAHFYAEWWTLIPTAFILGLGGGPLWSAKCTYLTEIGIEYAYLTGQTADAIISRFFGIFFIFFQSSQIWGNLISSSIFSPSGTVNISDDLIYETCGANFCPGDDFNNTNLEPPPDKEVYILAGVYSFCSLAAAGWIAIFFDQLPTDVERRAARERRRFIFKYDLLLATVKHLRQQIQLVVIPVTIYSGLEQAFIAAEFTRAYITCSWGIDKVGYVMIIYGVTNAAWSLCTGQLVKLVGRVPLVLLGAAAHVAVIIALFLWKPHPDESPIYFVLVAGWAIGDATWQIHLNAFYGVLFKTTREAAFSNYRLWESLGFVAAYAWGEFLCVDVKMWITLSFLILGMLGYAGAEILWKREEKTQTREANSKILQRRNTPWNLGLKSQLDDDSDEDGNDGDGDNFNINSAKTFQRNHAEETNNTDQYSSQFTNTFVNAGYNADETRF